MGQPLRHAADYENDFAAWAEGQARLLRSGMADQADLENIAEELDGLSRAERRHLERFLDDSPSLKAHLPKLFLEAYEDGRFEASKETKLDPDTFPAESPFSLTQIRDPEFVPPGLR